jgi:hypothetical protein
MRSQDRRDRFVSSDIYAGLVRCLAIEEESSHFVCLLLSRGAGGRCGEFAGHCARRRRAGEADTVGVVEDCDRALHAVRIRFRRRPIELGRQPRTGRRFALRPRATEATCPDTGLHELASTLQQNLAADNRKCHRNGIAYKDMVCPGAQKRTQNDARDRSDEE